GFPKADIVERYTNHGAMPLNTAQHGAIHIRLNGNTITTLDRVRQRDRRYWHTQLAESYY
ncbi:MAG: hypothetical protein AAF512_25630, partial [Pseudomonadota bacterium]